MSRDEIIAAIQKCAEELGHVPTVEELLNATRINKHLIRKRFGTYRALLGACGLERQGSGYEVKLESLFLDWARVARMVGKVPSMSEYALNGEYSNVPLTKALWRLAPRTGGDAEVCQRTRHGRRVERCAGDCCEASGTGREART